MAPKQKKETADVPSKRSKKASAEEGETADWNSVLVLGAPLGSLIRGVLAEDGNKWSSDAYASVEGATFQVVQGCVWPSQLNRERARQAYNSEDELGWAKKLSKFRGISVDAAQAAIGLLAPREEIKPEYRLGSMAANPYTGDPKPMRDHAGNVCKLKVVSVGASWQHLNLQIGQVITGPQLSTLIYTRFLEDRSYIGHLCLRRGLWIEGSVSGRIEFSNQRVDTDVFALLGFANEDASYYRIEEEPNTTKVYKMPASASAPFSTEDAKSVFQSMIPDEDWSSAENVFDILNQAGVSFGSLKSLIQKLARFRPRYADLPGGGRCNAKYAILAATLLLVSTKGDGYLPDLHLSVRGVTNAAKRLAVIFVEDAWPLTLVGSDAKDHSTSLNGLLSLAMASQRVSSYHPSYELARAIGSLAVFCIRSKDVVSWRGPPFTRSVPVTPSLMNDSARLLRILRAFTGDMNMMDKAASMSVNGRLSVRQMPASLAHPSSMPLSRLSDQHKDAGIGHMLINFPTLPAYASSSKALGGRFRAIFDSVNGFNPRLVVLGRDAAFDPTKDPVPQTSLAQEMMSLLIFRNQNPLLPHVLEGGSASVSIHPSIIAQAVGPVAVTVKTTAAEDGEDAQTWKLLVLLGTSSSEEVVIHFVNARSTSEEMKKKPKITEAAKQKAILAMRMKEYAFRSDLLKGYTRAYFEDGSWKVASPTNVIVWSWDAPILVTIGFFVNPAYASTPLDDSEEGIRAAKEAILAEPIPSTQRNLSSPPLTTPLAAEGVLRQGIEHVVREVSLRAAEQSLSVSTILHRILSIAGRSHTLLAVPAPARDGGMQEKEIRPIRGDWIVYRAFLLLSALFPSALQSKSTSHLTFSIPDARAFRHLESILHQVVDAGNDSSSSGDSTSRFEAELDHVERMGPTARPHQQDLLDKLLIRDSVSSPTRGCMLSLDMGAGKSGIAILYALTRLSRKGDAQKVIWVTKRDITNTAYEEMTDLWKLRSVSIVDREQPMQTNFTSLVNIVAKEDFSGNQFAEALTERMVSVAEDSFFICDEVHEMYAVSIENSNVLQAVSVCPAFLCMTATPAASPTKLLALQWLDATVHFPVVSTTDVLVAGSSFVSGKVDIGVDQVFLPDLEVVLTQEEYAEQRAALQVSGGWARAAEVARRGVMNAFVTRAVEEARNDRASYPGGGALVFMDNRREAEAFVRLAQGMVGGEFRIAMRDKAEDNTDTGLGMVVTIASDVSGYNMQRMGVLLTGVYASNANRRHQMLGRIHRVGQVRPEVKYLTVVAANSILSILLQRHRATDSLNMSFDQMAQSFLASEMGL